MMMTRVPVNWRAVGAAVGLALTFDVVLALFGVRAAADHPSLPRKLVGPAAPRAPRSAAPFKRRDTRGDEELRRQLFAAPELDLDAEPGTAARVVRTARHGGSRFADPVCEPLSKRPDLQGLPVALGGDCRLDEPSARALQVRSSELRRHLAKCVVDGVPDAALLRHRLLDRAGNLRCRDEEVPALEQILQAEGRPVRLLLVELLSRAPGRRASAALAARAVFDPSAEVREAAARALVGRPPSEYRPVLLDGLRYPWAPAADHAAEALVALDDLGSLPQLADLLGEPDPALPAPRAFHDIDTALLRSQPWPPGVWPATAVVLDERQGGRWRTALLPFPDGVPRPIPALADNVSVVREVVRVNHLRNCLLCHAASFGWTDPVRGPVPSPDRPLPPPETVYYEGQSGTFVRADVTYLRQDFSVPQPVANPGKWPVYQRYDYVVRTRYPTEDELRRQKPATYPQREAVLWALNELGARDG
jgi:hypothetical protein